MNGVSSAASPSSPALVRGLGPVLATAVVVGTIIGSGIFKKPSLVAEKLPEFHLVAAVWILGGLLALLGSLAYAEVAVLYPKAGGNYVFLREGYGRLAGFLWGWVEFWIIRGGSIAALATIFSESLHDILRNHAFQQATGLALGSNPLGFWAQKGLTVATILALALVNVRGVRWGGVLQLFITLVKVASLLGIMALPFVVALWTSESAPSGPPATGSARLEQVVSVGGFLTALLGVLWAYHGWMNITPVAEEVKDPQRNLPLAILAGTAIIIFLYLGANWSYHAVIPREELAMMKELSPEEMARRRALLGAEAAEDYDKTVAIGFSRHLLGPIGAAVAAAAVMCSVFGALNGNLLVGPRVLYAMGEDRLAPRALGAIHGRYRTPAVAILVLGGWAATLVLAVAVLTYSHHLPADKPHFDILTDFAMFGATTFETLAVATIFVFRRRFPDRHRPYRCWGYPFVPILYCSILAAVVVNTFVNQTREALIGLGFITVGAVVYFWIEGRRGRPAENVTPSVETAIRPGAD